MASAATDRMLATASLLEGIMMMSPVLAVWLKFLV